MELKVKLIDFSPRYESFLAYVARVSTGFDFATYENPRRRELPLLCEQRTEMGEKQRSGCFARGSCFYV